MSKTRVAVLMGGKSGEHAVSLESGKGVLKNLNYDEYEACPVVITREGRWHCADAYAAYGTETPFNPEAFLTEHPDGAPAFPAFLLDSATRCDVVLPVLHGRYGEDGALQGLLDLYGIPCTGSGVLGSALAMHKRIAKEIYQFYKILTPEYSFYSRRQWQQAGLSVAGAIAEKLGLPVFIKTPESGSSIGMGMARTRDEVRAIAEKLLETSDEILVEKTVKGIEVSCGVLETLTGDVEPLMPTEILPVASAFFDYKAKYEKGGSREITPARIPPALLERVRKTAVAAHQALHCRGMSRTDMIIADDSIFVLETNTLPGFTETSLLPQGAAACGIPYPELLDRIIACALKNR
ncbi:MAG: D-alanine--D-alanine ligase family protein [Fibrobacterota bacterium]